MLIILDFIMTPMRHLADIVQGHSVVECLFIHTCATFELAIMFLMNVWFVMVFVCFVMFAKGATQHHPLSLTEHTAF